MKKVIIAIVLFITIQLQAQKVVEKSISANKISTITIDGDAFFKIKIETAKTNQIALKTKIEGEYSEHMVVLAKTKNDSLLISGAFQPLFKNDNDKLSAHKVLSVELQLTIPEKFKVYVKSVIASAEIKGNFKDLTVELSQGNCVVDTFKGNATINTINGDIVIETNNASCKTRSKTGVVKSEELALGSNDINLNSVNGDITITNSEK